jgi:ketosteroid isomerase-like protein
MSAGESGAALSKDSGAEAANRSIVGPASAAWAKGEGGPFGLLADDARWTIKGNSLAAGTYESRNAFMEKVIRPFNARMKSGLVPRVRQIHAEGDMVVIPFDEGVARDGKPYRNTYTWHLRFRGGKIIEANAFFDSIAFNDLWQRVSPERRGITPAAAGSWPTRRAGGISASPPATADASSRAPTRRSARSSRGQP